jgi:hypothetical protein
LSEAGAKVFVDKGDGKIFGLEFGSKVLSEGVDGTRGWEAKNNFVRLVVINYGEELGKEFVRISGMDGGETRGELAFVGDGNASVGKAEVKREIFVHGE